MNNNLNKSHYKGISSVKLLKVFLILLLVCLVIYCKSEGIIVGKLTRLSDWLL